MDFFILFTIIEIVAILIVISIHEFAHAWAANYLGDPTAKINGRLSLNPFAHLDLVGTLMFVFFKIGWGKPVPFNPNNLENPRKGSALIALAGPASNFFTAILLALPLRLLTTSNVEALMPVAYLVGAIFNFSIVLMAFNLLPIPPLDGSKILMLVLPKRMYQKYDQYLEGGMTYFIVFILVDYFMLGRLFGFSIIGTVIGTVFDFFKYLILLGT